MEERKKKYIYQLAKTLKKERCGKCGKILLLHERKYTNRQTLIRYINLCTSCKNEKGVELA